MKTSTIPIVILSVVGIVALLLIAARITSIQSPVSQSRLCIYTVTGEGAVMLTYRNESGGIEQKTVSLPPYPANWALEMHSQRGAHLYLSAQKQQVTGSIRAVVYVDGQALQEAEANAAYGIAVVSVQVP